MAATVNTPNAFTTTVLGGALNYCALDATHGILAWSANGSNISACVVTWAGTVASFGSATTFGASALNVPANGIGISGLTSTTFILGYGSNTNGYVVGTVSGGTITFGTVATQTGTTSGQISRIAALTSTAFATYRMGPSAGIIYTDYCTISGTTITIVATATYSLSGPQCDITSLGTTTWALSDSSNNVYVASFATGSITLGTPSNFSLGNAVLFLGKIDSTHFTVSYVDSSLLLNVCVCTVSGTTISKGTIYTGSGTYNFANYNRPVVLSSTSYLNMAFDGFANLIKVQPATLTGSVVSIGTLVPFTTSGVSDLYTFGDILGTIGAAMVYDDGSANIYATAISVGSTGTVDALFFAGN